MLLPKPTTSIAEIRFKNGRLTQAQFAESLGVTPQTVSAWEKDVFKISPRNLAKIHDVYGINSSDLLGV